MLRAAWHRELKATFCTGLLALRGQAVAKGSLGPVLARIQAKALLNFPEEALLSSIEPLAVEEVHYGVQGVQQTGI